MTGHCTKLQVQLANAQTRHYNYTSARKKLWLPMGGVLTPRNRHSVQNWIAPCVCLSVTVKLVSLCRCDCSSGYTGKNCSHNVDDCASHICQNGAACEDGVNSYRCVCSRGYAGRFCEIAPVPGAIEYYFGGVCENHDCKNGGLCIQPPGSPEYVCKCPPGSVLSCTNSCQNSPI